MAEPDGKRQMKKFLVHKVVFLVTLVILLLSCLSAIGNVRIMSYNIKDFWLRFDGEPGSVTNEGARLDEDDFEKLEVVAGVINREKPDVIGILECASLAELLFFNERFLEGEYRCWSFRAYDSRTFGIPLGLMVKKDLEVNSVDLAESKSFSSRGIVIADIKRGDYEFALIFVHLKSKIERKLGESALKKDKQGNRLRKIIKQKLEKDPSANIVICGDFNDAPGRDDQEKAAKVEDLMGKMAKPITLGDGTRVAIHSGTLEHRDVDMNGELWTEKSKGYAPILFDYFFLSEGASNEFLELDHIYPEEFPNLLEASDHIPIVLDLGDE
ncbi:hypothetical protein E3J95_01495 [Candidatus Aerophobetes bacterium]|uniref:Endonuclease/exonuclease/phosphatase domain-containing protein n=1 Tax=Aerophobetes bacterium TaxID=2030807 RepID=A0A523QLG9_UNCAE|nr:MAG: hypothetical protein E3J95_01495 [Candidatus Aerophobetes bacterium]